jgi:hypothetical protein
MHYEKYETRNIEEILEHIDALERRVVQHAMMTPHQRKSGELPPRKKEHAVDIENITKDPFGHVHQIIAKELGLSRKTSKAKEEATLHRNIKEKLAGRWRLQKL